MEMLIQLKLLPNQELICQINSLTQIRIEFFKKWWFFDRVVYKICIKYKKWELQNGTSTFWSYEINFCRQSKCAASNFWHWHYIITILLTLYASGKLLQSKLSHSQDHFLSSWSFLISCCLQKKSTHINCQLKWVKNFVLSYKSIEKVISVSR